MDFFNDLLIQLVTFIAGNLPSNFFDNQFISTSLDFFQWMGWVVFAISTIFLMTGTMERYGAGEYVAWSAVVLNWFKALVLVSLARPLVIFLFVLFRDTAYSLVSTIMSQAQNISLPTPAASTPAHASGNIFQGIWSGLTGGVVGGVAGLSGTITGAIRVAMAQGIVFVILLVVSIVMTIQLLRIFGIMYVQIITGYLAVVDLMLGNGGVFYDWLQNVMSVGLTFMLQYVFYIGGVVIIEIASFNSLAACAPGLVLIVAAPAVPMALRRFGHNAGGPSMGGSVAGLARTASSVGMAMAGV